MDIPAPAPAPDYVLGLTEQDFPSTRVIHPYEKYLEGERLETDVEEQGFLREFSMGSWFSSQPVRFGTTRVDFPLG